MIYSPPALFLRGEQLMRTNSTFFFWGGGGQDQSTVAQRTETTVA